MKYYTSEDIARLSNYEKQLLKFMHTDEYINLGMSTANKFGAELINLGAILYRNEAPIERMKRDSSELEWLSLEVGESTTTSLRNRGTIYSSGVYHGKRFTSRKENGRLTVTRIA